MLTCGTAHKAAAMPGAGGRWRRDTGTIHGGFGVAGRRSDAGGMLADQPDVEGQALNGAAIPAGSSRAQFRGIPGAAEFGGSAEDSRCFDGTERLEGMGGATARTVKFWRGPNFMQLVDFVGGCRTAQRRCGAGTDVMLRWASWIRRCSRAEQEAGAPGGVEQLGLRNFELRFETVFATPTTSAARSGRLCRRRNRLDRGRSAGEHRDRAGYRSGTATTNRQRRNGGAAAAERRGSRRRADLGGAVVVRCGSASADRGADEQVLGGGLAATHRYRDQRRDADLGAEWFGAGEGHGGMQRRIAEIVAPEVAIVSMTPRPLP